MSDKSALTTAEWLAEVIRESDYIREAMNERARSTRFLTELELVSAHVEWRTLMEDTFYEMRRELIERTRAKHSSVAAYVDLYIAITAPSVERGILGAEWRLSIRSRLVWRSEIHTDLDAGRVPPGATVATLSENSISSQPPLTDQFEWLELPGVPSAWTLQAPKPLQQPTFTGHLADHDGWWMPSTKGMDQ